MRAITVIFAGVVLGLGIAEQSKDLGRCCYPGICVEPPSKYKKVLSIKPRLQWNINGGFCGSLSIQVILMGHGAWISQDLIRKANIGSQCFGHGDKTNGCEVGPENYAETAKGLKLKYDVWNYNQTKPQAPAFKAWIKSHLVKGAPVMWAPMEKGEYPHQPYGPQSCPGGGAFDHHEPIIGIGSNHDLSDTKVYEDDWVLHFSAQDKMPYYRNFSSLEDDLHLDGNCQKATTGFPDREAFPCFYEQVAYGLAVNGLAVEAPTFPVEIDVDRQDEPNVRSHENPVKLHATVTVNSLISGKSYILYRYTGINSFPTSDFDHGYEYKVPFVSKGISWIYRDPQAFLSNGATYYIAIEAKR